MFFAPLHTHRHSCAHTHTSLRSRHPAAMNATARPSQNRGMWEPPCAQPCCLLCSGTAGLAGQHYLAGVRTRHGKANASTAPGDAQHLPGEQGLEWQCLNLPAACPNQGGGREAAGVLQGARAIIEVPGQEYEGLPWSCWQQIGKKTPTLLVSIPAHTEIQWPYGRTSFNFATAQEQPAPSGSACSHWRAGPSPGWAGRVKGAVQSTALPHANAQQGHPPPSAADKPWCAAQS